MMKLNLGCGRVIFPLDRDKLDEIPYYNSHLNPLSDSAFEPGWMNVDQVPNAGVNEIIDLFRFPWIRSSNGSPFNDDSIAEIYCGHLLEHVPHIVQVATPMPFNWAKRYNELVTRYDGFFVFFHEAWRILKPDGTIHIRSPFAFSLPAVVDPTHTRFITPGSFSYLTGQTNSDAPFDYEMPCKFELVGEGATLRYTANFMPRLKDYSEDKLSHLPYQEIGVVDEVRITLRAVK